MIFLFDTKQHKREFTSTALTQLLTLPSTPQTSQSHLPHREMTTFPTPTCAIYVLVSKSLLSVYSVGKMLRLGWSIERKDNVVCVNIALAFCVDSRWLQIHN